MQDDRFDAEIKKALQDFEGHGDPSASWSQMNDRLDQEFGMSEESIEDFDENIRSHVKNYTVPVSESDWIKLKTELNNAEERKEKIIISKAIEIATILLLILTVSKYKTLTTPALEIDPAFLATMMDEEFVDDSYLGKTIDVLSEQEYVLNILSEQEATNNSDATPPTISSTTDLQFGIQELLLPPTIDISQRRVNPIAEATINIPDVASLPILAFDVDIIMPEPPLLDILYALDSKSNSIRDGWSIGLPISTDINFINTSFNVSYLRSQLNNNLSGKTFGLTASYRKGILEVETGARYSVKRFAPGLVSYTPASTKSFLRDELDEAKFKQIQIPLIAKIYASPNRNVSFYGMTGIATNIILDLDYTISKSIQANARPSSLPYVDVLDLKNLPKGFAEGGDVHDNLYMTAIVGFGVQYHMSNKLAWYFQPQYQHTLTNNINDVASKINSISIEAGLKYQF